MGSRCEMHTNRLTGDVTVTLTVSGADIEERGKPSRAEIASMQTGDPFVGLRVLLRAIEAPQE